MFPDARETCLDVTGDGYFTETGFGQTPGSFTFTTQATGTLGDTELPTPPPALKLLSRLRSLFLAPAPGLVARRPPRKLAAA